MIICPELCCIRCSPHYPFVAAGVGVSVDEDTGVDDGVGVDDDAGVDDKVGTNVGTEGSAGAGVVLAGFSKPGTGSVFWPFTVIVVAREIPTAIPRMLIMMTMTTRPARSNSFFGGC